MDKELLLSLLTGWEDELSMAISGLEEYPILKNGRKEIDLQETNEVRRLWGIKYSVGKLIERLEKSQ